MLLDRIGIEQPMASFFTLSRVDGLALGALAALLARGPGGFSELIPKARWLAIACGVMLTGALIAAARHRLGEIPHNLIPPLRLGLFAACLVLAVAAKGWLRRIFSMPWLIFLGKYSYALYVFHYMMMPLLDRYVSDKAMSERFGSFIVGMAVHLVICIAASIVVALASWHLLEKHFLKLKRYFVPNRHERSPRPESRAALAGASD
jgi:peptidoglycan/LPS O-acetylase OafA/YrhL